MKKILLFASVLMAMTTLGSCSKNETLSVNQIPNEISFSAYTNSTTKADIVNTANFKDFVVYGYQTEANYSGTSALGTPYIDALSVTREDDSKPWSHENKYYWPVDGKKMQVFALSPNDALVTNYATSETTYPTFNYTIGEVGSTQKDLVVSSLINQTKPEGSSSLVLDFKHVLSQINFSVKGEAVGLKYHVSKIELLNIKNSGKFTFNTSSKVGVWSNVEGVATYAHNLADFVVEGTTTKALSGDDKAMILMPQVNTENAKIKVTYSVTDDNGGATIFDGSKEIDLSSLAWTMNSNIRYTLTLPIGAEEITFETSVTPWGEEVNEDFSKLELNVTELNLDLGQKETLVATLFPKNESAIYQWSTNDPFIATVDNNGTVTAIGKGTVKISVTVGKNVAYCMVNVGDPIVHIPDADFKWLLTENKILNKDGDGEITYKEAEAYTGAIEVVGWSIKSLEGIEAFKNITSLDCQNNSLTSLDLSNNLELRTINCADNNISSLSVLKHSKLEYLSCSNNTEIKNIDVSNNLNLDRFECENIGITTLDVSKNLALTNLSCSRNNISSLDVSLNKSLKILFCQELKIATLDVSLNKSLNYLNCMKNPALTQIFVWEGYESTLNPLYTDEAIAKIVVK